MIKNSKPSLGVACFENLFSSEFCGRDPSTPQGAGNKLPYDSVFLITGSPSSDITLYPSALHSASLLS